MEENSTKLLINLVRSFPELYDSNNERYKDNIVRANAWKAIAERLECTADFCQNAWVGMQEEYLKEKKRLDTLPSESNPSLCSKWPWYNDMKFLDCDVQKIKNTSTPTSTSNVASQSLEESDGETEADSNNAVRAVTVSNVEEKDTTDSRNEERDENDIQHDEEETGGVEGVDVTDSNNDEFDEAGDEIEENEEIEEEDEAYSDEDDGVEPSCEGTDESVSGIEDDSDSESELYQTMASFANQMIRTVTKIVKPVKTSEDLFGELVASHLKSIQEPIERINKKRAISKILFLMDD